MNEFHLNTVESLHSSCFTRLCFFIFFYFFIAHDPSLNPSLFILSFCSCHYPQFTAVPSFLYALLWILRPAILTSFNFSDFQQKAKETTTTTKQQQAEASDFGVRWRRGHVAMMTLHTNTHILTHRHLETKLGAFIYHS